MTQLSDNIHIPAQAVLPILNHSVPLSSAMTNIMTHTPYATPITGGSHQKALAITDHSAPSRSRRRNAYAEKAQARHNREANSLGTW
jgi:hypothetical protein